MAREPFAGEFELIAALREAMGRAGAPAGGPDVRLGSGDDAAVSAPQGATVTSVDALVEGVHFRRETAPLRSVGRKALATALSDLAAMGAEPGEAYVQLGVPEDLDRGSCLEIATGIGEVAAEHGVAVVGGDVTRAREIFLAITAVGHARAASELVSRAGARPGERLAVTGELGGAGAGLLLLERPELGDEIDPGLAAELRARQLDPAPRLVAGRALAAAGATAMIDLSDGLAGDAQHVAAASRARLVVELADLPLHAGVAEVASAAGVDALDLALTAGEDYELLAALPAERVAEARDAVGAAGLRLTVTGRVEEGLGLSLLEPGGGERRASGFDQLLTRTAPGEDAGRA